MVCNILQKTLYGVYLWGSYYKIRKYSVYI